MRKIQVLSAAILSTSRPEEWKTKGHEYDEVRDCMLGWDITDYGLGDFDKFGFSLITIRNGCRTQPEKYPKVYAEKLLYLKEGQMAANHFHWYKTEDIINRGGGNCLIRVYNSLPNEEIDYESDVTVHCDGLKRTRFPPGTQIRLTSGRKPLGRARNVPRLRGRGGHRRRSAGRGQPVQRRQHRQPLQPACRPLPEDRRRRTAVPSAVQ